MSDDGMKETLTKVGSEHRKRVLENTKAAIELITKQLEPYEGQPESKDPLVGQTRDKLKEARSHCERVKEIFEQLIKEDQPPTPR